MCVCACMHACVCVCVGVCVYRGWRVGGSGSLVSLLGVKLVGWGGGFLTSPVMKMGGLWDLLLFGKSLSNKIGRRDVFV